MQKKSSCNEGRKKLAGNALDSSLSRLVLQNVSSAMQWNEIMKWQQRSNLCSLAHSSVTLHAACRLLAAQWERAVPLAGQSAAQQELQIHKANETRLGTWWQLQIPWRYSRPGGSWERCYWKAGDVARRVGSRVDKTSFMHLISLQKQTEIESNLWIPWILPQTSQLCTMVML